MTIEKTQNGNELIIKLCGHLDTITAPELEAEFKTCLVGINSLVFDLEGLEYVSSAGLRTLLLAHKTMSRLGGMKIINVCETVKEIFDITGFIDIFTIE